MDRWSQYHVIAIRLGQQRWSSKWWKDSNTIWHKNVQCQRVRIFSSQFLIENTTTGTMKAPVYIAMVMKWGKLRIKICAMTSLHGHTSRITGPSWRIYLSPFGCSQFMLLVPRKWIVTERSQLWCFGIHEVLIRLSCHPLNTCTQTPFRWFLLLRRTYLILDFVITKYNIIHEMTCSTLGTVLSATLAMHGKWRSFVCMLIPAEITWEVMDLTTLGEHRHIFASTSVAKWAICIKVGKQHDIIQCIIHTNFHSFDIFIDF